MKSAKVGSIYAVRYHDAGLCPLPGRRLCSDDLLIVSGGPMGVDESEACPLLEAEFDFLRQRLAATRPTFGICLGVQFHPEGEAAGFERWSVGHACGLAGAGLDPRVLRADAARHGARRREAGQALFDEWLADLPA